MHRRLSQNLFSKRSVIFPPTVESLLKDTSLWSSLRVWGIDQEKEGEAVIYTDRPELWAKVPGVKPKYSSRFIAANQPEITFFSDEKGNKDETAHICAALWMDAIETEVIQGVARNPEGIIVYVEDEDSASNFPESISGIKIIPRVTGLFMAASKSQSTKDCALSFKTTRSVPDGAVSSDGGALALYFDHPLGKLPLTAGHSAVPRPVAMWNGRRHGAPYNLTFPYEGNWTEKDAWSFWHSPERPDPWAYTKRCVIGQGIDAAIGRIIGSSEKIPNVPVIDLKSSLTAPPFTQYSSVKVHTNRSTLDCVVESKQMLGRYLLWHDPFTRMPVYYEGPVVKLITPGQVDSSLLVDAGDSGSLVTDTNDRPLGMIGAITAIRSGAICFPLSSITAVLFPDMAMEL